MIEWLPWLPNNSGFMNYNVLETLTDSCSTPPTLKILHNVVGKKRYKSGRVKFSNVEGVDNSGNTFNKFVQLTPPSRSILLLIHAPKNKTHVDF